MKLPPLDKASARATLIDAKRVLDKLNVPFFLNYGTCLGAVREKDFIDEDYDIDLGIIGNERIDEIRQALIDDGFTMTTRGKTVFDYIPAKKHVPIDFFVYRENGEYLQCWVKKHEPWLYFPKRFGTLSEIDFLGEQYLTPSPVLEFLTWVYGDWSVKSDLSANDNWLGKI